MKPEGMSAAEWEEIQALPHNLRKSLLDLRETVRSAAPSTLDNPPSLPQKQPRPFQLPLWPEPQRASPNAFLRSALFPAIQGKNRRYVKNELIATQQGYEIRFLGQQLDQSDFDIWLQAAHLARCSPLGTECRFTGRGFLKAIGRTGGGANLDWLKTRLAVLQSSTIEIKTGSKWVRLNLLIRSSGDDETTTIILKFDPLLIKLFAADSWTALQWEERRQLKGKPLALWLHGYYSSHAAPHPIRVETLRDMCGSETKAKKHFTAALKRAFEELEQVTGIRGAIEGDLVTVSRLPSPSQARHLLKKTARGKRAAFSKEAGKRPPERGDDEL